MQLNTLSRLTAQPVPFAIDGQVYLVAEPTISALGKLQAWLDAQAPDPFAIVEKQIAAKRFTPAQERHLLSAALEQATAAKPQIGSEEAESLLRSRAGMGFLVYLSLLAHQPRITAEQAELLVDAMGPAELTKFFALTGHKPPTAAAAADPEDDGSDPKAAEAETIGSAILPIGGGSSTAP